MSVTKRYYCNLCRGEMNGGPENGQRAGLQDGYGFDFTGTSTLRLRAMCEANNHICHECVDAVGKLYVEHRQPPQGNSCPEGTELAT